MAAKGGQWKTGTFVPAKATKLVDRALANAVAVRRLFAAAKDAQHRAHLARTKRERAAWMQRAHELQRRMQERGAARDRAHQVLETRTGKSVDLHHITGGRWSVELTPATLMRPSDARRQRENLHETAETLDRHVRERKGYHGHAIGDGEAAVLQVKARRARASLAAHDAKYDEQGIARGQERAQLRAAMAESKSRLPTLRAERDARRARRAAVLEERAKREEMRARRDGVGKLRAKLEANRAASAARRAAVEKKRAAEGAPPARLRPVLPASPKEVARAVVEHEGKQYGIVATGEGKRSTGATWYGLGNGSWNGALPPRAVQNKLRRALRKQGIELTF